MYSEKLEDIPKDKSQAFQTYLSEVHSGNKIHIRRRQAARKSGLDEATVQVILSDLTSEGVLVAKLQVRCPYCNTQHGVYSRQGAVPDRTKRCFSCENDFQMNSESNWEVIYEIAEDPGDFFQNYSLDVKRVFEDDRDLPPGFFIDGLERLKNMDNPQSRGREFDYFIGILFQQLNEVEVRVKEHGNTGEVDLHLICLDSDDWLYRLVGSHTLVENKWEKDPIQKGEISNFHDKASELPQCEISYFVSMSGFSRGQRKQTGALANLRNLRNPQIVDIWDDDLEEMVSKGTPEPLLRDRIMM